MFAPIALFVYCRYEYTKRVLDLLCQNPESKDTVLYIYSDAAKTVEVQEKVDKVRELIRKYAEKETFRRVEIVESCTNRGLANSIINGVTETLKKWDRVIVLEDDLMVSKDFIKFMNALLDYYEKDEKIGAVSGFTYDLKNLKGYTHDTYLARTGNSWGWATWRDIWIGADWEIRDYEEFRNNKKKRKSFDRNQYQISNMLDRQMRGEIDSWAVRWDYYFWKYSLWTVYPSKSRVRHEGFDGLATHCKEENDGWYLDSFEQEERPFVIEKIFPEQKLIKETAEYNKIKFYERVIKCIKRYLTY